MGSLDGRVIIITGGGTGLGKAMALTLAGAGADIVLAARRREPLEETAGEVRALGRRALVVPTDVADSAAVNRMVAQTLTEMGRLDILINNAGIVRGEQRKPIWDITDADWRLGMDTNLTGSFYCCRAVGKHFVSQKSGKVINVASGFGMRGVRDSYMYCCAKGGVIQLTRSLALTWAGQNIQVNCIVPGLIDVSSLEPPADRRSAINGDFIPTGRAGLPRDITALALFLCGEASDYITGGTFIADGGGMTGGCNPTGYAPAIPLTEED